jgi:hypothetical protein
MVDPVGNSSPPRGPALDGEVLDRARLPGATVTRATPSERLEELARQAGVVLTRERGTATV